ILVNEIISMMPDVNEITLFSDNASSQFKNQYVLNYLTHMMDAMNIDFSWNYFASTRSKGVVDGVGGILKRLVWLEIMAGKQCSSADDFVKICREKSQTISTILVRQAQLDVTKLTLEKLFSQINSVPDFQKQHHFQALHKDVIQFAEYDTSDNQYVYRF
ncbi:unnamed protein product, partial [Adineta steineri]